jgi:magnesium transporter/zinc transporter
MQANIPLLVDESGLAGIAFAFCFDAEGHGVRISDVGLIDTSETKPEFWWVNVNLADLRGQAWLNARTELPLRAKRLMLSADLSDRVEVDSGVLAGVMADVELALSETTDIVGDLHFAVGERFLITGRKHPLHALQALRLELESEPRPRIFSSSDLFAALIEKDVARVGAASKDLSRRVDELEDRLLKGHSSGLRKAAIEARRKAVALHRQVNRVRGPFRSARLSSHQHLPAPMYGVADRVSQMLDIMHEDVHLLAERARLAQEDLSNRLAASTNRQLFVLSIISAAFLPPTLITGIFGMNTEGLPFKDDAYGFAYAIGLGALSAALVLGLLFLVFRAFSAADQS